MRHIIEGFKPLAGYHCVSTSIKQILNHDRRPLTEEMIFGLASGLNFIYMEREDLPCPLISGRTGMGNFEESLACNLGITIEVRGTQSREKANDELRKLIRKDIPVVVYLNMDALDYLRLPGNAHLDIYSVVVFGIDDEEGVAYLSDRDAGMVMKTPERPSGCHRIGLQDLSQARDSKSGPCPPKNRWLAFDLSGMWSINQNIAMDAIRETCTNMSCPSAGNLGLKGIELFSRKVREWELFDPATLRLTVLQSYLMIHEMGGTGGGAFRRMYGNFLKEAGLLPGLSILDTVGREYITLSERWDDVAEGFLGIYRGDASMLGSISESVRGIYEKEVKLINRLRRILCE